MFLYSQSVEDANNSGMNLLDQSVIKKGMDYSLPKVNEVLLCIHVFVMSFHFGGTSLFYKLQMFVHNYRTAAVWVKGHVGKKEVGRKEGRAQVENPGERDRRTETVAVFFLMEHLAAIRDTILNNWTTIMDGTSWETLLSKCTVIISLITGVCWTKPYAIEIAPFLLVFVFDLLVVILFSVLYVSWVVSYFF